MEMAYGSLMELVSEAEVARQQGFLAGTDSTRLRTDVAEIARMISGLRRNLREETRP